jgi:predicted CopG family antitoxin
MVGYRTVKVREDVYQRLARLADSSGKSMSDLIEELLNNYEGKASSGVVRELGEIKAMLRECLDRLGAGGPRTVGAVPVEAKPEANSGLEAEGVGGFEDNPWVQILRAKSRG